MKNYRILAKTNGYIASRDIHFNGRTSYNVAENLTKDEAFKKLQECLTSDYEFAYLIETEEEFVKQRHFAIIEEQASIIGMEMDAYYQSTKKRWLQYHQETANSFDKFNEAGFYSIDHAGMIMAKNGESYEFDSRYYSIEEQA